MDKKEKSSYSPEYYQLHKKERYESLKKYRNKKKAEGINLQPYSPERYEKKKEMYARLQKKSNIKNATKRSEKAKEYYEQHREEILQKQKEYRKTKKRVATPEEILKRKQYYEQNREAILAKSKERNKTEKWKTYYRKYKQSPEQKEKARQRYLAKKERLANESPEERKKRIQLQIEKLNEKLQKTT